MKRIITLLFILSIFTTATTNAYGQPVFNVKDYGAIGDGKKDDAGAIQKAIDACSAAGGGMVLLPAAHVFMSGPFDLRSNIEFVVEKRSKLIANPNGEVYTKSAFRENKGEGTVWIGGENLRNVTITGGGEINGNGIAFMGVEKEDAYELKPFNITDPRPHVLTIVGASNITIHDIIIGNSAYWTIHLIGCDSVSINKVTLLNSLKVRNSDGIDIDHSRNVTISNCHIESGDDCICLKNRREYEEFGPCENIRVDNCVMTSRSCAVKIGSENMDTIRNVRFNNCVIKSSNRGIGIQNRDEGVVSDVVFSNFTVTGHLFSDVWWGKAEPIYITAYRRAKINHKDANWRFPKGATEGKVGEVKNISFINIKCISENGVYVSAESPEKISNIVFDKVSVLINKTTVLPGGVYDRRPCEAEGFVKGSTSGFYFDRAHSITVKNCRVNWGKNKPVYFKHVVESSSVKQLIMQKISGHAAFRGLMKTIIH